MGIPKKRQPVVDTYIKSIGVERLREIVLNSDKSTTYLPKSIDIEDIDNAIFDKFDIGSLSLTLDGRKVPIIYMTNERWGEFEKTWQYQDGDKLLLAPYLTVKRTNKEPGTIYGGMFTVANRKTFKYVDVPTLEDGYIIMTRYKIPQPVPIDLTYDITLFSKYQDEINKFDELMFTRFSPRQEYIDVNGHYFSLLREGIDITDDVDDVDGNRLYKTTYELKTLAYLQNESEFEITKTAKFTKVDIGLM
jgi:hypothetical protein